jgi:hypothetical protein
MSRHRSREDRVQFKKAMTALIADGLHIRRGMSAAEYTAACKKAWDQCTTRPGFERRILIDPLRSVDGMLSAMPEEYVHWRIADYLNLETRRNSDEIRCVAVGAIRSRLFTYVG